jgi:hypothetical protein
MRQRFAGLGAALAIASGLFVGTDPAIGGETGRNPFHVCRAEGFSSVGDEFATCIDQTIRRQCTGVGFEVDSKGYGQCEASLRDTVLVTRVLEQRGYKINLDLYRFN